MTSDSELRSVARNIAAWQQAMVELAEAEAKVETLKAVILRLVRDDIPDAMLAAEVEEFTTTDGVRVGVEPVVIARLPPKDRPQDRARAIQTLDEAYNLGGIINVDVGASFAKGHIEQARTILAQLRGIEAAKPYLEQDVHWATLQKAFRERLARGEPVDRELFALYAGRQAKILQRR